MNLAFRGILSNKMLFSTSVSLPLIAPATKIARDRYPLTFPFISMAVAWLAHAPPRSMWIEIICIVNIMRLITLELQENYIWLNQTYDMPNCFNRKYSMWAMKSDTLKRSLSLKSFLISEECCLINISNLTMWQCVTELNNSISCRINKICLLRALFLVLYIFISLLIYYLFILCYSYIYYIFTLFIWIFSSHYPSHFFQKTFLKIIIESVRHGSNYSHTETNSMILSVLQINWP